MLPCKMQMLNAVWNWYTLVKHTLFLTGVIINSEEDLNVKFYEAINTFYARVNSVPIQDTFLMSNLIEHVIVLLPLDTLIF